MGMMGAAAASRLGSVAGRRSDGIDEGERVQLRLVRSAAAAPAPTPVRSASHDDDGTQPEDVLDLRDDRRDGLRDGLRDARESQQNDRVARTREDQVATLFRLHSASLTRLAGLLTSDRSSAEEVVQDAFVGLHRKFDNIRDPQLALAYLRASVVNGSRSKLRRRRTERAHIPPYLPPAASAEDGAMAREEHQQVRAGLRTLPRRQREVLVLRYHMDLSEAEIADALGISRGAVKGYASRALTALAAHLEESR
jgi:RNA polymerase sigma-70 factor (sigma-E family)